MKIGIDIGHGGKDPGAIGPTGLREKDVNLPVGLALVDLLKTNGFEVVVTRTTDVYLTLFERSNMLDDAKVDLVLSVHCNKVANPKPNYVATFIYKGGGQAEKAAEVIQEELRAATGWPGPSDPDGVIPDNLHMVRETVAPAVIVEMGFISNSTQEAQLRDPAFQKMLATALATGICRYFNVPFGQQKNGARLIINNQEIPGGAILIDGKSYVWTRGFAEALGHTVRWDAATRTVYVDSEPMLPRLDRYGEYDVVTCKPSQVIPATIKGILTVDGINGGYLDGTLNPLGLVVIDGNVVSERVSRVPPRTCLIITKDDRATISKVDRVADAPGAKHILGGGPALLPTVTLDEGFQDDIMISVRERTAVGIMPDGTLKLITTGRKTLKQLSEILVQLGCIQAVNFDGGGSTTMRFAGELVRTGGRMISTALILREG